MCRRAPSLSLLFALTGLKGSLSDCFHTSVLTPLDGGVETSMAQPHQLPPVRASDGEKLIFEVVEFTCKGRNEYDVFGPLVVRSTPRVTAALSVGLAGRHSAYARRSVKHSQGVRCGAGSGLDILLVDPEDYLAIQFKTSIDPSVLVVKKRV